MTDTDATVSKRLIISGLTPAIDANSLTQRLSSFGNVHSLVGVGMLDANGRTSFTCATTVNALFRSHIRCPSEIRSFNSRDDEGQVVALLVPKVYKVPASDFS